MDQPDLEPALHEQALAGLARINWWSNSAGILWPAIRALARRECQPLRLLDVATGAGDVPLALWRRARRAGLELEFSGCDRSPLAVAMARKRAQRLGAPVEFFCGDALRDPLPDCDIITSSLFLHHLDEPQAIELLHRLAAAAQRLVLVNDLERGPVGWLLAWVGTRVLSRSPVVHGDGVRSVEGAFTALEAVDLAHRAGWQAPTVERHWPCRFLLRWARAEPSAASYPLSLQNVSP